MHQSFEAPVVTTGDVEDAVLLPTDDIRTATATELTVEMMALLSQAQRDESTAAGFDLGRRYVQLLNLQSLRTLQVEPRRTRVHSRDTDADSSSANKKYLDNPFQVA